MAICSPNFNFLALTVSEIYLLKLLFSEIYNLKYGVSFDLNDPIYQIAITKDYLHIKSWLSIPNGSKVIKG